MRKRERVFVYGAMLETALLMGLWTSAQTADGNAGLNQANTMIRGFFDGATNLMYAAGGIAGLVGAYKVYQKMSRGDHDTDKSAYAWLGGCVFLVIAAPLSCRDDGHYGGIPFENEEAAWDPEDDCY